MNPQRCRSTSPWLDGAVLAAAALVAYTVLGRPVFHGTDMHGWLWGFQRGVLPHHASCTFYMPMLQALVAVLAPLGIGTFHAALLLSATGAATAVALAYFAARTLGLDRGTSVFTALLLGATPAVVFFATVVETHAPALPYCGVGWVAIAHWARQPGPARAALAGGSLVLAFLAHPTAVALGGAMLPVALLARGDGSPLRRRDLLAGGTIAVAILVAGILLAPVLLHCAGLAISAGDSLHYLLTRADQRADLRDLPHIVFGEWLVPFLPASVLLLALSFRRASRAAAIGMQLAVVPFLAIAWLLFESFDREWGAYTSALTWPVVVAVAMACRPAWARGLLLAVALGAAALLCRSAEEPAATRATAEAVRKAVGDRKAFWLLGSAPDFEAWSTRFHDIDVVLLSDLMVLDAATLQATLAKLDAAIAVHAARGDAVLFTNTAIDTANGVADFAPNARLVLAWLDRRRGRELANAGGVVCYALGTAGG